jgi:hypothetical protein
MLKHMKKIDALPIARLLVLMKSRFEKWGMRKREMGCGSSGRFEARERGPAAPRPLHGIDYRGTQRTHVNNPQVAARFDPKTTNFGTPDVFLKDVISLELQRHTALPDLHWIAACLHFHRSNAIEGSQPHGVTHTYRSLLLMAH